MILVTGTSGFIGSHFIRYLCRVSPTTPTHHIKWSNGRGYDWSGLDASIVETIVHLGAWIPKAANEAQNQNLARSNVSATELLLRPHMPRLQKIILASSIDVYGVANMEEQQSPKPVTEYGRSKLGAEEVVLAYGRTRGIEAVVLRLGHVYGTGEEHFRRLIPETMKKILRGQSPEVAGTGQTRRAYINALDVARCLWRSIEESGLPTVMNVASPEGYLVVDIVKKIVSIAQTASTIRFVAEAESGQDALPSTNLMRRHLIREFVPFEQGLREEWSYMRQVTRDSG